MRNKCDWYLKGFCCRDLDGGRVWECKKQLKNMRIKKQVDCEYFKKERIQIVEDKTQYTKVEHNV